MKHTPKITLILLGIFLLAQFFGIAILYNYIDFEKSSEEETVFREVPFVERPPVNEKTFFVPVILAVFVGTIIFLILLKYKLIWIMKVWYLIALFISLSTAFNAFIPITLAGALGLVLSIWKVFKPNFWVQNGTELFIYGGLAAIFVPLFNLFSGVVLLILIAAYDAYAVWKSKHMIKLAKSQTEAKMFAGLLIPYTIGEKNKLPSVKKIKDKVRTAILGGGDIGFPLIFAGIVLKELGLWQSLVIPFFATAGLAILFWKADHQKFYPAMPFISTGCLVGLGIVWLIGSW
ncbi:MAG TPA: presenilin family intramembrane aspartyl protease [Candidatus Nanoarchaeia archaeon]|nr:presenilin family intramembrane aspartyl protease [Candidatus Nanoarchaeia archaeon]